MVNGSIFATHTLPASWLVVVLYLMRMTHELSQKREHISKEMLTLRTALAEQCQC
jgi:hypothetical protein